MKRILASVLCVLLFVFMLLQPQNVFHGAQNGLLLWFQIVLPTLLPFMIMTNLLVSTNGLTYITQVLSPVLCPLFRVSIAGSFAIIAGFLCGYPLGAKVTADLLRKNKISVKEAQYLLSFCNNTSPAFILNYIVWKTLGDPSLTVPTITILLFVPVLMSILFRKIYQIDPCIPKNDMSKIQVNKWGLDILDHCIMDSFESIVKVGGYIILFSIVLTLLLNTSLLNTVIGTILLSTLEITNGVSILGSLKNPIRYVFVLALTSFGGFCSIAQTQCMLSGTPLKISHYIIEKLATGLVTSLIAYLYLCIF